LSAAEAAEKMEFIRSRLKPLGHKVSVSDALISQIEGILSRGDERAGLLFEQAYLGGSRLDAWKEYINRDKWLSIFEENRELANSFLNVENEPPWLVIDSCVSGEYIRKEKEKSDNSCLTPSCKDKCSLCGVCGKDIKLTENTVEIKNAQPSSILSEYADKNNDSIEKNTDNIDNTDSYVNHQNNKVIKNKADPDIFRLLFSFSKTKSAVFHGHLSLIEIFSMAFTRACIPVMYTKGFNPLAKMEFASPLSTGINAENEIASVDFYKPFSPEKFINEMNSNLPQGFHIENSACYYIPSGMKKHSLSSLLWGFGYSANDKTDYISTAEEKAYRQEFLKEHNTVFSLRRNYVLARNITGNNREWASYYETYDFLYKRLFTGNA